MSDERGEDGTQAAPPVRADCLCMGVGPELTQMLRRLGPGHETWDQLRLASVEVLKALRVLIDQQIEAMSREPERGTRVKVE